MHSLWGLQQLKYKFELKGGTSLSKGHGLIRRFSEDIDIRIEPPATLKIGRNHDKPQHNSARFAFYDDLAANITIAGVTFIARDQAFDDKSARSGGIRLAYPAPPARRSDRPPAGFVLMLPFGCGRAWKRTQGFAQSPCAYACLRRWAARNRRPHSESHRCRARATLPLTLPASRLPTSREAMFARRPTHRPRQRPRSHARDRTPESGGFCAVARLWTTRPMVRMGRCGRTKIGRCAP